MDDSMDTRNLILSEIIDKMHSRMADKMFPPDPAKMDEPAVMAVPSEAGKADTSVEDADMPRSEEDTEMSDEDLNDLMKSC